MYIYWVYVCVCYTVWVFFHSKLNLYCDDLIQSSERPSVLVICGDHGMSDQGGHGGASPGETSVPVIIISPHTQFQPQQSKTSKQSCFVCVVVCVYVCVYDSVCVCVCVCMHVW